MQQLAKKHATHAITGFELTKIVLHNLKHFGLKPQTKTVLWVLIDCYNPENGSVVFPSMEYIATEGAMGLTSAKEGIKELINKGLIIKSKRGKIRGNYNKYLLTPKVQNPTSEQPENELLKQSDSDRFMRTNKREKIIEKTTTIVEEIKPIKEVVVSLKDFSLKQVPESILAKKTDKYGNPIKSHAAYWNKFTDEQKEKYLRNEAEQKEKARKLKENKENELKQVIEKEIKKQKERQKERELSEMPITSIYTYEEACAFIRKTGKEHKHLAHRGRSKQIAIAFNIDIDALLVQ